MVGDDAVADREPKTSALPRRFRREERFEDLGLQRAGNPRSLVGHFEHGEVRAGIVLHHARAHRDAALFGRGLHRIHGQRKQHLHELIRVAIYQKRPPVFKFAHRLHAFEPWVMLKQKQPLLNDCIQIDRFTLRRFESREVEQTVDDLFAPLHFEIDDVQQFVGRRPRGLSRSIAGVFTIQLALQLHRLGTRCDCGEGIVDFVHDTGNKLPEGGELLGLRRAVDCGLPVGDVFTDSDDVRNLAAVQAHGDL